MNQRIKVRILRSMKERQDLKLLRGQVPWSLAGTSGDRYKLAIKRRDELVARINEAIDPLGGVAKIEPVDPRTGRLALVIYTDKKEVWEW